MILHSPLKKTARAPIERDSQAGLLMLELKLELKFEAAKKWWKALTWVSLRRGLVKDITEASAVAGGPSSWLVFAACTGVACLAVAILLQVIGIAVVPLDHRQTDGWSVLPDFISQTAGAWSALATFHLTAWAAELSALFCAVLATTVAFTFVISKAGSVSKRVMPPNGDAMRLAISGNLCLLVVLSTSIAALYSLVASLLPRVSQSRLPELAFDAVPLLGTLWMAVLGRRRTRGMGSQAQWWETACVAPIFFVLMGCVLILPALARLHEPSLAARATDQCDQSSRTCTIALTLLDARVAELNRRVAVDFTLAESLNEHPTIATLHAILLDEPSREGIPNQLKEDEERFVRLRFVNDPHDVCRTPSIWKAPGLHLAAGLTVKSFGKVLGKAGRVGLPTPDVSVKGLPIEWSMLLSSICSTSNDRSLTGAPPAILSASGPENVRMPH